MNFPQNSSASFAKNPRTKRRSLFQTQNESRGSQILVSTPQWPKLQPHLQHCSKTVSWSWLPRVVGNCIDSLSPDLEKRVTRLTPHVQIWTPEYQIWVWRVISTYSPHLASTPDLCLTSHQYLLPPRQYSRSGFDELTRVSTTRDNNWYSHIVFPIETGSRKFYRNTLHSLALPSWEEMSTDGSSSLFNAIQICWVVNSRKICQIWCKYRSNLACIW